MIKQSLASKPIQINWKKIVYWKKISKTNYSHCNSKELLVIATLQSPEDFSMAALSRSGNLGTLLREWQKNKPKQNLFKCTELFENKFRVNSLHFLAKNSLITLIMLCSYAGMILPNCLLAMSKANYPFSFLMRRFEPLSKSNFTTDVDSQITATCRQVSPLS